MSNGRCTPCSLVKTSEACSMCPNFVFYAGNCFRCFTANNIVCSNCPNFIMIGSNCTYCGVLKTSADCNKCSKHGFNFTTDGNICYSCALASSKALCSLCLGYGYINEDTCMKCSDITIP